MRKRKSQEVPVVILTGASASGTVHEDKLPCYLCRRGYSAYASMGGTAVLIKGKGQKTDTNPSVRIYTSKILPGRLVCWLICRECLWLFRIVAKSSVGAGASKAMAAVVGF